MTRLEIKEEAQDCPEFPFFGAHYPDARCIDGYLWDLDSYEDGVLTKGGEEPCPFCNTEMVIAENIDEEKGITRDMIEERIRQLKLKYSKQP